MLSRLRLWWYLRGLGSRSADRRLRAIRSLGRLSSRRAASGLLTHAPAFSGPQLSAAAESLAQLARAVPGPVIEALSHENARIRTTAASALGAAQWSPRQPSERALLALATDDFDAAETEGDIAIPFLVGIAGGEDVDRSVAAAFSLARLGHDSCVPVLVKGLGRPNDVESLTIIRSLLGLGTEKSVQALLAAFSEPVVARGPTDDDTRVADCQLSLELLRQAHRKRIFHAWNFSIEWLELYGADVSGRLERELESNPIPVLRETAADLLGRQLSALACDALERSLSDPMGQVKRAAAEALGRIGARRSVGPLCGLLGSTNPEVASAAAAALGEIGGQGVVEPLVRLLKSRLWMTQLAGVKALARVGDPGAVPALQALSKEPHLNGMVRDWTRRGLEILTGPIRPSRPEPETPRRGREIERVIADLREVALRDRDGIDNLGDIQRALSARHRLESTGVDLEGFLHTFAVQCGPSAARCVANRWDMRGFWSQG